MINGPESGMEFAGPTAQLANQLGVSISSYVGTLGSNCGHEFGGSFFREMARNP